MNHLDDRRSGGLTADRRGGDRQAAVALRTELSSLGELTVAERTMMAEWLDRIAVR